MPARVDLAVLVAGLITGFVLGGGAATSPAARRAVLTLGALMIAYLLAASGGAALEAESVTQLSRVLTMSRPFAFGFIGGLLFGWDAVRRRRKPADTNDDS